MNQEQKKYDLDSLKQEARAADAKRAAQPNHSTMTHQEQLAEQIRETKALNDAYAAKILRQNKLIESLKGEIRRLHEQQLDVEWEIAADAAGLDKETQDYIISMSDYAIKAVEEDKKYVAGLEAENKRLSAIVEAMNVGKGSDVASVQKDSITPCDAPLEYGYWCGRGLYHNDKMEVGAYVWFNGRIGRITNQNLHHSTDVIVENVHRIDKNTLKLVKVGELVKVDDNELLPERDRGKTVKITWFLDNGLIGTADRIFNNSTIDYGWLKEAGIKSASTPSDVTDTNVGDRDVAPKQVGEKFAMARLILFDQIIDLKSKENDLREKVQAANNEKQKAAFLKALTNVQKWIEEIAGAINLLKQPPVIQPSIDEKVKDAMDRFMGDGNWPQASSRT